VSDVQKLAKGSRYVELPDAGHSAYFESPAAFNKAIRNFLAEVGAQ
jgi:pimeloyl-ACP methyl ester carboxylesterase